MPTASQIKAARSFVGWSASELAQRTGIGIATIKRYETSQGIPKSRMGHLETIRDTLENAGIEFIQTDDGGKGVLFRPQEMKN